MAKESSFCHVFLSFKGETRDTFTCFLDDALKGQGYVTFMDKMAIRVGDEVDSSIKDGIKGSMSAIIVFSKNYAFSTWCLDELLFILERKKISRYFIIPIFYQVEPAEIKHQLGNYGLALEKHKAKHNDKVEKWRSALHEVGNILGEHVQGMHSIFIQNIVKLFGEKLSVVFPECVKPLPKKQVQQSYPLPSSSSSSDKVILYLSGLDDGIGGVAIIRNLLKQGNIEFEEKNCRKEPKYLKELEELVGKEGVKFPTVIVNGQDLSGEEYVEGLEGFDNKYKLKSILTMLHLTAKQVESLHNMMKTTTSLVSQTNTNFGNSSFLNNYQVSGTNSGVTSSFLDKYKDSGSTPNSGVTSSFLDKYKDYGTIPNLGVTSSFLDRYSGGLDKYRDYGTTPSSGVTSSFLDKYSGGLDKYKDYGTTPSSGVTSSFLDKYSGILDKYKDYGTTPISGFTSSVLDMYNDSGTTPGVTSSFWDNYNGTNLG